MHTLPPKISTIVRSLKLRAIRGGFLAGSVLAPAATVREAARLFATPAPSTRWRARAAPLPEPLRIDPPQPVAGCALQPYVAGDPAREPYVLLVHGWSSHATRFHAWVAPLRRAGFAVVAFDHPAHGRSEGQQATLPAFVDAVMAMAGRYGPPAAAVGHSLGGTALALALARGMPARRVVLIAPAADPIDAARRFADFVGLAAHLCRRMCALFESAIGIGFEDLQTHRQVPRIARPALIVHDLGDREVPWAEGERIARHWPDARLLTTEGLGHHRIVDAPEVLQASLRFLRGDVVGERVVSSPNLPFGFA